MRLKQLWILVFCAALAAPAAAQFYKYTDNEGNIRFTDDLSQIPEPLRSGATPYEQAESRPEETPPSAEQIDVKNQEAETRDTGDLNQTKTSLDEKKARLEAEYKALMERRALLEKERTGRKTRTQAVEHNKAVLKLNEDILTYEERRKAFDAEVEAYNARVKNMKEKPEKTEAAPAAKP